MTFHAHDEKNNMFKRLMFVLAFVLTVALTVFGHYELSQKEYDVKRLIVLNFLSLSSCAVLLVAGFDSILKPSLERLFKIGIFLGWLTNLLYTFLNLYRFGTKTHMVLLAAWFFLFVISSYVFFRAYKIGKKVQ